MDKHRKALSDWATRGVAVSDTLAATYRELLAWMERVRAETLQNGVDIDGGSRHGPTAHDPSGLQPRTVLDGHPVSSSDCPPPDRGICSPTHAPPSRGGYVMSTSSDNRVSLTKRERKAIMLADRRRLLPAPRNNSKSRRPFASSAPSVVKFPLSPAQEQT
jgi:hypothetical protein